MLFDLEDETGAKRCHVKPGTSRSRLTRHLARRLCRLVSGTRSCLTKDFTGSSVISMSTKSRQLLRTVFVPASASRVDWRCGRSRTRTSRSVMRKVIRASLRKTACMQSEDDVDILDAADGKYRALAAAQSLCQRLLGVCRPPERGVEASA